MMLHIPKTLFCPECVWRSSVRASVLLCPLSLPTQSWLAHLGCWHSVNHRGITHELWIFFYIQENPPVSLFAPLSMWKCSWFKWYHATPTLVSRATVSLVGYFLPLSFLWQLAAATSCFSFQKNDRCWFSTPKSLQFGDELGNVDVQEFWNWSFSC